MSTNNDKKFESIVHLLYEIGFLRNLRRNQLLTTNGESVAEHCFRAAIVGYFLAILAKAESKKVVLMLLFHDIAEGRTGDINSIQKKYLKASGEKAINDMTKDLISGREIKKIWREFNQQKTLEARLARDADILEQLIEEKEILESGNPEAQFWMAYSKAQLSTKEAKNLARWIIRSSKHGWWHNIFRQKK